MNAFIPMPFLEPRRVYRIRSRNLITGVWNPATRGFIGIRTKFDSRYLFTEYHREVDPRFGTALPERPLGFVVPDGHDLSEGSTWIFEFLDDIDVAIRQELAAERRLQVLYDEAEKWKPQTADEVARDLRRAEANQWRKEQVDAGRPFREIHKEWLERWRE